jgi:hypothetical protein
MQELNIRRNINSIYFTIYEVSEIGEQLALAKIKLTSRYDKLKVGS